MCASCVSRAAAGEPGSSTMSGGSVERMDPWKPGSLFLTSSSRVSLNQRFSQVLTPSRTVTFDPVLLQQGPAAPPAVLPMKSDTPLPADLWSHPLRRKPLVRRRSVWTRLGWQQVIRRLSASRPRGFWSFRNKYRWRARFPCTYRRRGQPHRRLVQSRPPTRKSVPQLIAGRSKPSRPLKMGGAWCRRRDLGRAVPTKEQLDAQLDEYMSLSKSRLDKELDEYMSLSRSRLDAELDEYMLMAGQMDLHWD